MFTALILGRCRAHFKVWRVHRGMPLLLGFGLVVALFIWLAENIGAFTAAGVYPRQRQAWGSSPLVAPAWRDTLHPCSPASSATWDKLQRATAGGLRSVASIRRKASRSAPPLPA